MATVTAFIPRGRGREDVGGHSPDPQAPFLPNFAKRYFTRVSEASPMPGSRVNKPPT